MFMGEYSHTIDAKGRVILPADFRAELGVSFVITKGLDRCLFLYAQAEWEALAAKLRQLPLVRAEARALARFFFSSARSLECDKQGRFLVPANLRSYAGIALKQTVVLTGTDSTPSSPFTSSATCTDSNWRISSARGWLTGNPINTQPMTTGARMGTITNW